MDETITTTYPSANKFLAPKKKKKTNAKPPSTAPYLDPQQHNGCLPHQMWTFVFLASDFLSFSLDSC